MKTVIDVRVADRKGEGIMQNVNTQDRHGHTPLIDAAKQGDVEQVKDLMRRGADVGARSEKGKTALHYAAANGHVEVVKFLLTNGAEVDARDRDWHTPLMLAAIYGCNHTVQALISAGADVHARTLAGNSAMVYAENNQHPLTLALLKKAERAKAASA
jgi:ankyrin repeat protein